MISHFKPNYPKCLLRATILWTSVTSNSKLIKHSSVIIWFFCANIACMFNKILFIVKYIYVCSSMVWWNNKHTTTIAGSCPSNDTLWNSTVCIAMLQSECDKLGCCYNDTDEPFCYNKTNPDGMFLYTMLNIFIKIIDFIWIMYGLFNDYIICRLLAIFLYRACSK